MWTSKVTSVQHKKKLKKILFRLTRPKRKIKWERERERDIRWRCFMASIEFRIGDRAIRRISSRSLYSIENNNEKKKKKEFSCQCWLLPSYSIFKEAEARQLEKACWDKVECCGVLRSQGRWRNSQGKTKIRYLQKKSIRKQKKDRSVAANTPRWLQRH